MQVIILLQDNISNITDGLDPLDMSWAVLNSQFIQDPQIRTCFSGMFMMVSDLLYCALKRLNTINVGVYTIY